MSQTVQFGKEWAGQSVDGRFPLEEYLGGSERSCVFATRLDKKGAKAAIKLSLADSGADAQLADWRRAEQLSHPHLLRVFKSGKCWLSGKELLYAVSEFADEDLAQVVPQRALTAAEADAMLRPALKALAYLHDRGLAHGHIRPSNVMAVGDQLKLSADDIQAAGSKARTAGPNAFDAPELGSEPLSPAVDSYSLGATLAATLTGKVPQGRRQEEYDALPRPYAEIVKNCMAKDPAARWTVRDIANAIQLELPKAPTVPAAPKVEVARQEAPKSATSNSLPEKRSSQMMPLIVLAIIVALVIVYAVRGHHREKSAEQIESGVVQPAEIRSAAPSEPAAPAKVPATSPGVVHQALPQPSTGALHTITGRVKVRMHVNVDDAGNVSDARFTSAGPSKYFSRLSMEAARQWKFTPGASARNWNLLFEFTRGGVQAHAEPAH